MEFQEHNRIVEKEKTKSFWYGAIVATIASTIPDILRYFLG